MPVTARKKVQKLFKQRHKKQRHKKSRWNSYGWLLINAVCWGAAFIVVKPALETTTPLRHLFFRFLWAFGLSVPLLYQFGRQLSWKRIWQISLKVWPLEMLGTALALFLLYAGLARTSAIEASLLATTQPIFITLIGLWLLREQEDRNEWMGLILAFFGAMTVAVGPYLVRGGLAIGSPSFTGNLLVVGALLSMALYFPLAKRTYQGLPKLLVTSLSFIVGILAFGILSVLESGSIGNWLHAVRLDFQQARVSQFESHSKLIA